MTTQQRFLKRWGLGPLAIYAAGILLPAVVAALRPELLPVLGLPAYAVLFWGGPFASGAAVFWSNWSGGWRVAWIVFIPLLCAPTFLPLVL